MRAILFRLPYLSHRYGALVIGLTAGQKRKDEPEYDDDYDYDNETPVKGTASAAKKDTVKDIKAKDSAHGADEAKEDDSQPKKKLEHPTSIFLKPRNTRTHSKVSVLSIVSICVSCLC
ncbi:hypothetical protein BIW11_06431 [Tropilaelaps mercedesae]|uniref:Uncharacterized protein n=1 Tax=Tropilaelaps mercedesae TaxID=418985 RepID=A0A1V9XYF9_9ACAR|nr:hypothetical protein BIW11_06431 [Tropilaelaps mercedesae]